MKIFVAGCFHGKFPKKLVKIANRCDLVLSTGDLGGNEKLRKMIFKNFTPGGWIDAVGKKKAKSMLMVDYNSGINIMHELSKLKTQVYTIDGNWDFTDTKYEKKTLGLNLKNYPSTMKKEKNIKFLGHGIKKIRGLNIYSHGGLMFATIYSKDYGDKKNKSLFDKARQKRYFEYHIKQNKELFKRKASNLDIFIAHCPPYKIFDEVIYKGKNPMNGKHVGFIGYNNYIKKYHPKLFICGHMHEHQGIKKLDKTTILSHGAAQDGKAAIIDWNNRKFKIRLIK